MPHVAVMATFRYIRLQEVDRPTETQNTLLHPFGETGLRRLSLVGAQEAKPWKCFLYCNGLMDHIYVCQNGTSCSNWYKKPTHFSGTLDAFVKITRHEGLRSLWSGLPPTLAAMFLFLLEVLPDVRGRKNLEQLSLVFPVVFNCNVCVIVGAVTVISPLELVRTKMQSRKLTYSELQVCIRSAVAQGGLLSLWRGWGPTVLRDVPFSGEIHWHLELH
ncbi:hypothetical protein GOODEAATRI_011766 [Goodea atripinnis]|uniref:Mitochondrial glutathione transporter SLC25A39 n=1 Tax=Goodea atripinnis TaxID=208336 RepID=A0ABV0NC93_9TELE